MTKRLYLLRHGQTPWNLAGRAQGQSDVPLDDVGRAQAEAAATYVAALGITGIWTSDLSRARETAEILAAATGVPVKQDLRLREYSSGWYEGLTFAEVQERLPGLSASWDTGQPGVPGAELYADVAARIVPACRDVLEFLAPAESALVVSHGACLKVAIAGLLGWPLEAASTLRGLDNCHLARLDQRSPDQLRLVSYGVPPNLDAPVGALVPRDHRPPISQP